MPPIWPAARRLEGRVPLPVGLGALLLLGAICLALSLGGHPLPAVALAAVAETLCYAVSLAPLRVYRAPRLASRLGRTSRMLDYAIFTLYYAALGMEGAAIVASLSFLVLDTSLGDGGDEAWDAAILAALLLAAALLEASPYAGSLAAAVLLRASSLVPILAATGLVAARLIYREATGL